MSGVVRSPSRSVLSGQQSLQQRRVWSAGLPDCREWLTCPPEVSGVVGRLFQRVSGVVDRPSWSAGSGQYALPKCREWLLGPPGVSKVVGRTSEVLGVVGMPFRSVNSDWQALPECWEWSVALLECREWSAGPPKVS